MPTVTSRAGFVRCASAAALALALAGCGAVQLRGDGGAGGSGPSIEVVIRIVFGAARAALPAAVAAVGATADLSPGALASLQAAHAHATAGLAAVDRDLAAYAADPTRGNQCRLHADERAVLDAAVAILSIARDFHADVPPAAVAALGAVGPVVDALQPGCGAPPPVSAAARLRAALARGL